MEKSEVLNTLETKHDEFRARIADLPEDAYEERFLGEWDLRDLLTHMAGWWTEMTGGIERVSRGERPTPEGVSYRDSDAWNAQFTVVKQPDKGAALRNWDDAYRGYADAARELDESLYGVDPESGRERIGNRLLDGAGIHHFDEHRPQIEEWLAARG